MKLPKFCTTLQLTEQALSIPNMTKSLAAESNTCYHRQLHLITPFVRQEKWGEFHRFSQNLSPRCPCLCVTCPCQGHTLMGTPEPLRPNTFAPWTMAACCGSAWINSLDAATASQLEMCLRTHTLVLSTAHTICLWCPTFLPPHLQQSSRHLH